MNSDKNTQLSNEKNNNLEINNSETSKPVQKNGLPKLDNKITNSEINIPSSNNHKKSKCCLIIKVIMLILLDIFLLLICLSAIISCAGCNCCAGYDKCEDIIDILEDEEEVNICIKCKCCHKCCNNECCLNYCC